MTLIDIRRTADVLQNLEESKRKSDRLYEGAYQINRQLKNLSGIQQVRRTLEHILEDMLEEKQVLEQMNRCLEESCQTYSSYENEITELAEETNAVNPNELGLADFTIPENLLGLLR